VLISKNFANIKNMAMFRRKNSKLSQIKEIPFKKEKDLQELTEKNLDTIFGLQFVATEYRVQNLYIDTLAFDLENKTFVIIEYKRDRSFSVVDQGFSYLSLMLNNKAEFILAYNESLSTNLRREDVDWSQARVIFIARSFTAHQQNAINFKNMPFELWEAVQFENDFMQYRRIEISSSAESLEQLKSVTSDTQKVAKEVKKYTEEDLFGKEGEMHDLYISLKEQILQMYPDLVPNPKKIYVGYQMPDNWRNIFNVQKARGGILIHFMRSKPKDFDDPQNKLKLFEKAREYYNQDIAILEVKNEKDIRYAMLMIQQAYERFVKEFGS
jgi:predicted transport protein